MIRQLYSIQEYQSFIDSFCGDEKYSDPHMLYAPDTLYEVFQRKNRIVLGVFAEEQIIGLFVFLVLPEDHYVEMLIGLTRSSKAIREIESYLKDYFPGYLLDFVINPNHDLFLDFLTRNHAELDVEQMKMEWKNIVDEKLQFSIIPYEEKYHDAYCDLHSKDLYWTSHRVLEAKDRFRVYLAVENEKVIGYLDVTYCFEENEPYSLKVLDTYQGKGVERDLLLKAVQENQPHRMMVLVDVDQKEEIALYESVGFVQIPHQNSLTAHVKG